MKKIFLSLFLALALLCAPCLTAAAADAPAQNMAGKTVIIQTNDVHGAIEYYACVAQMKKDFEDRGAEVVLTDGGDYVQGSIYVNVDKGASVIGLMNAVGYDVVTVGNHDLDFGYQQLENNLQSAEFAVVCANMFDAGGKSLFDGNYTYTTASGLKIGFFGLQTPEAMTKTNPVVIRGLQFGVENLWQLAQRQINALSDADLVICLSHLGDDAGSHPYNVYDLWENTTGMDFVLDAHSHTVMTEGVNGEPIQSTGTELKNIGVVVIDDAAKKIEDHYLVPVTDDLPRNAAVAAETQKIVDSVSADYAVKFAKSTVTLNGAKAPNGNRDGETNNGDLITDAMRWKILSSGVKLDVPEDHAVAVQNGGGIRAAIVPGDVTKKDINTVYPFSNTLAVVYVSGKALLETLEASTYCLPDSVGGFPQVSGISYTVDTTRAYAPNAAPYPGSVYFGPASVNRVTINDINGKPFSLTDTYAVITNNFCAAGGDTYYALASAKEQFDTGILLDETLMEYIAGQLHGVIGDAYAAPQGRITILTAPAVSASAQTVQVNGSAVAVTAYNIDGCNYFMLRDLAVLLNDTPAAFSVEFDKAARTVCCTPGAAYAPTGAELATGRDDSASCVSGAWTLQVRGKAVDCEVYNIGGYNYFRLRDLASALGFGVDYDAAANTALISAK